MKRLIILTISLIFIVAGIFTIVRGVEVSNRIKDSVHWPSTKGKIISSEIVKHLRSGKSRKRLHTLYRASIEYEYLVNSQRYTSNVVTASEFVGKTSSDNRNEAQRINEKYPAGKEVIVFYDPDNPEHAVLESGNTDIGRIPIIVGLCLTCLGILGLFMALKMGFTKTHQ